MNLLTARSFAAVLLVLALPARAASLIVDTAYVEKAIAAGALLWDARAAGDYAEGHIPGAVNIGNAGSVFRDMNREDPPAPAVAAKIFGEAGMDILGREVVVYTTKGDSYAYYAARMVEYYGGQHAKVYHGGLDDWKAAGKAIDQSAVKLPPVKLSLTAEMRGAVGNPELIERVKSGKAQIIDARTPKEFSGEDIRAVRGGHVPGALPIPYEQNWQDPAAASKLSARQVSNRDGMALKSREDLKKLYAKLDPEKETIVYCQSGVRASETAAVLRDLGFKDVKVHEPSWLGYAGVLSAPAENEVFVNVGALNGMVSSLAGRVRDLEAEVARLQAAGKR